MNQHVRILLVGSDCPDLGSVRSEIERSGLAHEIAGAKMGHRLAELFGGSLAAVSQPGRRAAFTPPLPQGQVLDVGEEVPG